MHDPEDKRVELAALANEGEIARYVHDPSPKVIRALLLNRLLAEEEVLIIANRKNIPGEVLETFARAKRWAVRFPVGLALARNPKSPLSISLSIARYLRLFDLEEITHCHFIPLTFRHKVEAIFIERIATMPLGNKKTLAKKAAGNILLKLLQDSDPEVVQINLNSPYLVEGLLYKVISRAETVAGTIRMIAEHPNWSSRSLIQFTQVRNTHTPLSSSVRFLRQMKIMSLRELYVDPSLPVTIKPFVHRELWDRGEDLTATNMDETVYEIDEEDDDMIAEFEERAEKSDE